MPEGSVDASPHLDSPGLSVIFACCKIARLTSNFRSALRCWWCMVHRCGLHIALLECGVISLLILCKGNSNIKSHRSRAVRGPTSSTPIYGLLRSAGRPLRSRKEEQQFVKGAEIRGPCFSATTCAVLCACWRCHVLIGSTGVICEKTNMNRTEGGQSTKKEKRRVHTNIPVPGTWHFA